MKKRKSFNIYKAVRKPSVRPTKVFKRVNRESRQSVKASMKRHRYG